MNVIRQVALTQSIISIISLVSSIVLISLVLRECPLNTHHRLLVAMSVYDIIWKSSVIRRMSSHGFLCVVQATLSQFGSKGVLMTFSMLSLYYVLLVKYNLNDGVIKRRIEPFMHIAALLFASIISLVGIPLHLYNPNDDVLG